jgi:protocadherin alpha
MATATVLVSLVDSGQAPKASSPSLAGSVAQEAALVDVNVYLIIAICAVSSLLVLTLLLYTALRCSAAPTGSMCGPGKPMLVCSSAVGSWSYSQQRRQRVCSGEVPPKTDLMAFSPGLAPGLNTSESNEHPQVNSDLSGNVSSNSSFALHFFLFVGLFHLTILRNVTLFIYWWDCSLSLGALPLKPHFQSILHGLFGDGVLGWPPTDDIL